jgi:hypothetical protein
MFLGLTDFSRKRSALEALGFYIVYFLLGLMLGAIAGGIGALLVGGKEAATATGLRWGAAAAPVFTLLLGGAVCVRKSLPVGYYFVVALGALLALFAGNLLGLIPVAFLTTRPVRPATSN